MRGVTCFFHYSLLIQLISTHTPHARRDVFSVAVCNADNISTHTPHARRDVSSPHTLAKSFIFLLTRLMRGVTGKWRRIPAATDFYSHASCEAWPAELGSVDEGTTFLLTRLMRGVTGSYDFGYDRCRISTHTPHARRDLRNLFLRFGGDPISTHTPHARRDRNI